jgi:hypothetical protein
MLSGRKTTCQTIDLSQLLFEVSCGGNLNGDRAEPLRESGGPLIGNDAESDVESWHL